MGRKRFYYKKRWCDLNQERFEGDRVCDPGMQSCKLKKLRKWIVTECYKCLLFTHSPIPHQQYKSGLKSFKHISLGTDFIFLETLFLEPSPSLLGSDCCSPHLLQSLRTPFTTIQVGLVTRTPCFLDPIYLCLAYSTHPLRK